MSNELKSALLNTSRRFLRPVVRILIKSGISWKQFTDAAKISFVEVATDEFGIRGRPTNLARVAILTGINRREVARQRDLLDRGAVQEPVYMNAAQRVLSAWHQDALYLDKHPDNTHPKQIAIEGPAPSFADLCTRYAGDIPASALLKELRISSSVKLIGSTQVQVLSRVYIPLQIDPENALRAGGVLEDLGNALEHNLSCPPDERRRLERRAENDAIDPKHLAAFHEFLAHEGQAFLERVDDWLTAHEAQAVSDTPDEQLAAKRHNGIRLGVGIYHIQDHSPRARR